MGIVAAVAAVIAAGATGILIYLAWEQRRESRRRRLTDLSEIVSEIEMCIAWGKDTALRRDTAQERLRMQLGDIDLPATRSLAYARLKSGDAESESAKLAAAAGAEIDRELGVTERRLVRDRVSE